MHNLLIVEDDPGLREQMKWALCEAFEVAEADGLAGALEAFGSLGGSALVCLDMGLEGRPDRGLDVIDALLAMDRGCKIVAVTASTDEALGREAIRRGAFDYLQKPVDTAALRLLLDRAMRIRGLEAEPSWKPARPQGAAASGPAPGGDAESRDGAMLGESEAMQKVFSAVRRLAPVDASVLVTGEPGTGKEVCARALHAAGPRRDRPFVAVRCAGASPDQLEADLFGDRREGAGSGPCLIEEADGGTLFLDEIGDLPPSLQARLMRFLQDPRLQRPGEARPRALDVRLVASVSRPAAADGGSPRTDLQHRLGEFEIVLPPLRDRGRDALLIAQAMVERNRARFSQPRLRLSSRAEKLILSYGWPGNVRELETRISRAAVACRGQVIEDQDLQVGEGAAANLNYREQRRLFERNLLINALKRTNGNVSLAARTMGVTRPTFYDMMKKSGVQLRLEPRI